MAHFESNAAFPNSVNYALQVGNNLGNINCSFTERTESPPNPHVAIKFPRDQHFVDRETALNDLHKRREKVMDILHHRLATPGSRTALVGLGGVGKSQLAIEYAYQAHEKSPGTWIFWAYASNAVRFESSYRQIAETVKLSGRRDPTANISQLVDDWLRNPKNGKWVLILDNLDDAEFLLKGQGQGGPPLKEYLGQSQNGSILITSRSKEAALTLVEHRDIISITEMGEAEARELFEKKLPQQKHCESITKLARALDFIPLTIVQAAAYISDPDRKCSVRNYLKNFQGSDRIKTRLLDKKEGQFRRDWDANNSILITWQISFESLRHSRISACDLLSLMSLFENEGIPKNLLEDQSTRGKAERSDSGDDEDSTWSSTVPDDLDSDIYTLKRYSFISVNKDETTFRMHRLVQLAMRNWLESNGEREWWNHQCIHILNSKFPKGNYGNCTESEVLFPHVKCVAAQRPKERESLIEWASLLHNAAKHAKRKRIVAEAEKLSIQAMNTRMEVLGPENPKTLESLRLMGDIDVVRKRWKEAEERFLKLVETTSRVPGAESFETLGSMTCLAWMYMSRKRYKDAELLFTQITRTTKQVLEAEELLLQVMEMHNQIPGMEEHPTILLSMRNLASTYMMQERPEEAEDLLEKAKEMSEQMLGTEHPETLDVKTELASAYMMKGQSKKAEEVETHMMEMRKRILGVDHPYTLRSMRYLAWVWKMQGRLAEARDLLNECMTLQMQVLGADNPDTAIFLEGAFDWEAGQFD